MPDSTDEQLLAVELQIERLLISHCDASVKYHDARIELDRAEQMRKYRSNIELEKLQARRRELHRLLMA